LVSAVLLSACGQLAVTPTSTTVDTAVPGVTDPTVAAPNDQVTAVTEQLAGLGFSPEEASCVAGKVDLNASADGSLPMTLLAPAFDACGLTFVRLGEIGLLDG
jgi:hypothetical protein